LFAGCCGSGTTQTTSDCQDVLTYTPSPTSCSGGGGEMPGSTMSKVSSPPPIVFHPHQSRIATITSTSHLLCPAACSDWKRRIPSLHARVLPPLLPCHPLKRTPWGVYGSANRMLGPLRDQRIPGSDKCGVTVTSSTLIGFNTSGQEEGLKGKRTN